MRKSTLQSLKKKFWRIFSEHSRRKDADEDGLVKCISCSTIKHWKEMDAGHYLPKSLGLSIYFEERNVHAQCQKCNIAYHGNQYQYALSLKKRYGEEIIAELEYIQSKPFKFSKIAYAELIEHYEEKLKKLNETKVLKGFGI